MDLVPEPPQQAGSTPRQSASGNGLRQQVLRPHRIVDVEDPLALAQCIRVLHSMLW